MPKPTHAPHHPPRPLLRRARRWTAGFLAAALVLVACTDVPPHTPGPRITAFAADPATAAIGASVTLSWQTVAADALRLQPLDVDVTGTTSLVVTPIATTTYTLVATNGFGSASDSIVVSVGPVPVIDSFASDAGPEINPGLPATLSWSVDGADRLDLLGPGLGAGVEVTGSGDIEIPSLPAGARYTLVASNAYGSVEAEAVASRDVPAFSILVAGQSNAQGINLGSTAALDYIDAVDDVRMFGNDYVWKAAYEPLDDCLNQVDNVSQDPAGPTCTQFAMNNSGVSAGVSLGNAIAAATGGEVFLVPAARGSLGVNSWLPGTDPYDRSRLFGSAAHRARLPGLERAAPIGHEFDGAAYGALVWYQGETDSGDSGLIANFKARTRTVLDTFRAELDAPTLLVQLSRRGPTGDPEDPSGIQRNLNYQIVREIQRRLATGAREATSAGTLSPDALPRTYLVVTHDLPLHPGDGRHLSAAGQVELGRRLGLAVREHLLGEDGVDGSGPQLVRVEKFSTTEVLVHTDRPVTTTSNDYSGYFTVVHSGSPVAIASVQRSATDDRVVRILLGASVAGPVQVRYMPPPGIITVRADDVVRSASCGDETIPGTSLCLPMAAFGDVMSAMESNSLSTFVGYDESY